jgi:D-alanyl-lipoteichoic acid acyltransferase DltB (MBOAT superfamily)
MTHFCYYNSLAISGVWELFTAWDIFVVGYGVLNFMWLKFLLIWRYFRLWALIGGIETPENMPRCINNCYDLEGFWKSWHASYNRWLVRYLYIPLGGSHTKMFNVWIIFTFVAIWHDLEWKLLSWALVTCLIWMPEILCKSITRMPQVKDLLSGSLLRELGAIGGAITISCLMMANLIGFVVGPTRMQWLISRMLLRENVSVLIGIFISFYVGTKLMFHVREVEALKNSKQ